MKETELRMEKSITALSNDLAAIRAGRANPAILDKVTVEYYGSPSQIQMVGNISVPEPRTILIQPWDASLLGEIEKAINKADLGINPNNDGKCIRLNFPPLSEERRKELVKGIQKRGEDAKVAIRGIRRDSLEGFKKQKKDGEITEDDLKNLETKVQKLTDKFVAEVDEIVAKKEKEILEV
ncbi:MAG: ribosome recycling factor [Clostridia bacterium]|nr:ribosome recycling factor [Clostridia bacterium]MBO5505011.1 ribosome recycling factor [Clostridia bacterium]